MRLAPADPDGDDLIADHKRTRRDPLDPRSHDSDIRTTRRFCHVHDVLPATNPATEMLLMPSLAG